MQNVAKLKNVKPEISSIIFQFNQVNSCSNCSLYTNLFNSKLAYSEFINSKTSVIRINIVNTDNKRISLKRDFVNFRVYDSQSGSALFVENINLGNIK